MSKLAHSSGGCRHPIGDGGKRASSTARMLPRFLLRVVDRNQQNGRWVILPHNLHKTLMFGI